jgi:hypothetical protein
MKFANRRPKEQVSAYHGLMAYHVVALSRDQFFQTGGSVTAIIGSALMAESRRSMELALRDRENYNVRTFIDCLTMDALQPGGLPAAFRQYHEIFLFNNPALGICKAAGMNYPIIATIAEADLPEGCGVVARLPLYLHKDDPALKSEATA